MTHSPEVNYSLGSLFTQDEDITEEGSLMQVMCMYVCVCVFE